jgi:hypothetical protein
MARLQGRLIMELTQLELELTLGALVHYRTRAQSARAMATTVHARTRMTSQVEALTALITKLRDEELERRRKEDEAAPPISNRSDAEAYIAKVAARSPLPENHPAREKLQQLADLPPITPDQQRAYLDALAREPRPHA